MWKLVSLLGTIDTQNVRVKIDIDKMIYDFQLNAKAENAGVKTARSNLDIRTATLSFRYIKRAISRAEQCGHFSQVGLFELSVSIYLYWGGYWLCLPFFQIDISKFYSRKFFLGF